MSKPSGGGEGRKLHKWLVILRHGDGREQTRIIAAQTQALAFLAARDRHIGPSVRVEDCCTCCSVLEVI